MLRVARRMRLLEELVRDPRRFAALVRKDLEMLFDTMRHTRAQYDVISWDAAAKYLSEHERHVREILAEPSLAAIEDEVEMRSQAESGPWTSAYNADAGLAQCAYLACRLVRPTVAIETGVAYGVTSAYILAALDVNGHGTLHSIDLAPLGGDPRWIGALVPPRLRSRWKLHVGSSRTKLPEILALGPIDLFLHDSLHTYSTMRWELRTAWAHLGSGGAILADDVQSNSAFWEVSVAPEVHYAMAIRGENKRESAFGFIRRR